MMIDSIVIFLVMVAVDWVWASYTKSVTEKKPIAAGVHAVGILAFGAVSVIGYTSNHWLLIPACGGAFVGTYLAVKFGSFPQMVTATRNWFKKRI
jgi:hypothetical protein